MNEPTFVSAALGVPGADDRVVAPEMMAVEPWSTLTTAEFPLSFSWARRALQTDPSPAARPPAEGEAPLSESSPAGLTGPTHRRPRGPLGAHKLKFEPARASKPVFDV